MALNTKQLLQVTALGVSVVLLTPFIAGFLSNIEFMSTSIFGLIDVGTALAAGAAAWVADYAITMYWK